MSLPTKPSKAAAALRVLVITGLTTILSGAVALFIGIVSIALLDTLAHRQISMDHAYRYFALPVAAVALVVGLVGALVYETRYQRRTSAQARLTRT